jgi:segregation and condensation protein A
VGGVSESFHLQIDF